MQREMAYDPVLIVDAYNLNAVAKRGNYDVDSAREAEGLSSIVRVLGNSPRQVAIVPEEEPKIGAAYNRAGFQTVRMNGNRHTEIVSFIDQEMNNLFASRPNNLVLVTSDPAFNILASSAAKMETKVSIWSPGSIPPQLTNPQYTYRRLGDLLPNTIIKVAKVAVYLDYENLHIGLKHMGITPVPKFIIEAVRALTPDLGNVVDIEAYADWSELSKDSRQDIQRELAMLGVKTHYQISRHGKNSADMALANDIRTRIGRQVGDPDAVDIIVLGSRDRDFSTIVKEAQKDKRVIILGLSQGFSKELENLAEVRYLETQLAVPQTTQKVARTGNELMAFTMRVAAFAHENKYTWVYDNKLAALATDKATGIELVRNAVDVGILKPQQPQTPNKLILNLSHPDACFAWWLIGNIDFHLNKRKLPYVDSNFLWRGAQQNQRLQEMGAYQKREEINRGLERGLAAGCLVKESIKHPKDPTKTIDTWYLAAVGSQPQSPRAADPLPADPLPADPLPADPLPADEKTKQPSGF